MAKKSVLTQGKKLKGDDAARDGRVLEARDLFLAVCRADPTDVEAWVKLSIVEKRLGHFKEAETLALRAIALRPKLGFAHHAYGVAIHSQGRFAEAISAYRKAINFQPDFADAHYLLGCALQDFGSTGEAIVALERALLLNPSSVEAMGNLAAIHLSLGVPDLALSYLEKALSIKPGDPVLLCNNVNILRLQGRNADAIRTCRHALTINPDSTHVLGTLAVLLEKTGELDEARVLVERGLALDRDDPLLSIVAAQLARQAKHFDQAINILESLPLEVLPVGNAGEIELLLGQLYDALNQHERAFPLIVSGKAKKQKASILAADAGAAYRKSIERISSFATPALAERIVTEGHAVDENSPVFLIGFPRSGTTLLDQILDAHPNIRVMEEKAAVALMVNKFLEMAGDESDALAMLDRSKIDLLRQAYFAEVGRQIDLPPGVVLIDKLPLNLISVPVISRVFPRARYILAIRHPCDACLSCLMQDFSVNDAMASFYSLADTIATYESVMGAWQKYVDLLPIQYRRIRYEDLIQNVEAESRKVLEFLGLDWDDAMLNHVEHAKSRPAINTPSYHQVTQPIYQQAKFRWKRYEAQFEPYLARLQSHIRYFDYAE